MEPRAKKGAQPGKRPGKRPGRQDGEGPTRGGTSTLRACMDQFLRQAGLNRSMGDARVMQAWREALGPLLAPRARPVRFRQGELTVEVQSAAHHQELSSFTGEGFRHAANERLGAETIRRVTFRLKQ